MYAQCLRFQFAAVSYEPLCSSLPCGASFILYLGRGTVCLGPFSSSARIK